MVERMCRRTTCRTCHKPTYAGCGAHIEQVLADVPRNQRCSCRETKAAAKKSDAPASDASGRPWWRFWS
jgi:hypothetical protein